MSFARSASSARKQIRTTAVVANAAASSAPISIPQTKAQKLGVWVDFTLGSLTNASFDVQVAYDGSTFHSCSSPGILTLTASAKKFFVVDCAGAKAAKLVTTSSGTTTSSDALCYVSWQQS